MSGLRIAVGADEAGIQHKEMIKDLLVRDPRVAAVLDLGVDPDDRSTPYPEIGVAAAQKVVAGEIDRAVLVCGTGIGMAISANKVAGVRATVAHDSYSVERSVLSNNCQILTLGERVVGAQLARKLVTEWLGHTFDPGSPSQSKVALIDNYERTGRTSG